MICVWGCMPGAYPAYYMCTHIHAAFRTRRRVGAYPLRGGFSLPQAPLASASIVRAQTPENMFIVHGVISFREFYNSFQNVHN